MKLEPKGDRVIVRVFPAEEVTAGGIIIPDTARDESQEGEVLAIGPGKRLKNGKLIPPPVKVGDIILFAKYGGKEIEYENEDLLIVDSIDIHAICTDSKKRVRYNTPHNPLSA